MSSLSKEQRIHDLAVAFATAQLNITTAAKLVEQQQLPLLEETLPQFHANYCTALQNFKNQPDILD